MAQESKNLVKTSKTPGMEVYEHIFSQQEGHLTVVKNVKRISQQTETVQMQGSNQQSGIALTGSRLLRQVQRTETVIEETTAIYQQHFRGGEDRRVVLDPKKLLGQ